MPRPLPRHSLIHQVAELLREDVARGTWKEWLPRERDLCRDFQVCRVTLRRALGTLRDEGWLETIHGIGTRVTRPQSPPAKRKQSDSPRTVGLLSAQALDRSRMFRALFVDDLRALLIERGYRLMLHEYRQVERKRPAVFLERLVAQHNHDGWFLMTGNPAAQLWFEQRNIPVVISGTRAASRTLPVVSLDSRALGRHAAATLLRYGHRCIGLLLFKTDPNLRNGLEEVLTPAVAKGAKISLVETDESASAVARVVDRLLGIAPRPTAIFVASARPYLTVQTRLAQHGLRIPQDISLLCRDDETFLEALLPAAARYTKNPHLYAKKLHDLFMRAIEGDGPCHDEIKIMPEFVNAASLRRASD